jgi:hypothetical protein
MQGESRQGGRTHLNNCFGEFSLAAGPLIAILGKHASSLMGTSLPAAAHVHLTNKNTLRKDPSEDFQHASIFPQ